MTENVKCKECGNSTYCEPCDKDPANKGSFEHICFQCFQKKGGELEDKEKTHLCVPKEELEKAYDKFLGDMTHRAFEDLWSSEKKRLKDMSKQELAKTCFFEGAGFMLEFMRRMSNESEKQQ